MSGQAQAVETPATATTAPVVAPVVETTPPVTATQVETPVVEPKAETKIEVDAGVSKHFAELERRKAAFEKEKAQLAEQRKAEEGDRKAFDEWRASRDIARKDPVKGFALLGMTADDVAKALYEAPQQPSQVDTLQSKLDELQAKIDADNKARTDAERAKIENENLAIVRNKINEALAKPEFELTRARGPEGSALVFDVMAAHWSQHGEVLDFDKACDAVEKHFEALADAALSTEKYKRKLSAKVEAPKTEEAPKPAEKKQPPADPKVVLSNKTSADTPPGDQRPTDADYRARAVRALKERMAARQAAHSKKGA